VFRCRSESPEAKANPASYQDRHPSFQDQDAQSPFRPEDSLWLNPGVKGPSCTFFQGSEGVKLEEDAGWVEFHVGWEAQGPKVSPPNVCIAGQDAIFSLKTLSRATYVSEEDRVGYSFAEKAAFESREEHRTTILLGKGLSQKAQMGLLEAWRSGGFVTFAAKYKQVAKKVKPVNQPMLQELNPLLQRPPYPETRIGRYLAN
jgi:hypothetical protein